MFFFLIICMFMNVNIQFLLNPFYVILYYDYVR